MSIVKRGNVVKKQIYHCKFEAIKLKFWKLKKSLTVKIQFEKALKHSRNVTYEGLLML